MLMLMKNIVIDSNKFQSLKVKQIGIYERGTEHEENQRIA